MSDDRIVIPPGAKFTGAEREELLKQGLIDEEGNLTQKAKDMQPKEIEPTVMTQFEPPEPVRLEEIDPAKAAEVESGITTANEIQSLDEMPASTTEATPSQTFVDTLVEVEEEQSNKDEPEVTTEIETPATARNKVRTCPQCGWELELKPEELVKKEDMRNFMRHILGGPETRFTRREEMLGKRFIVTFRSRLVKEAEAIFDALASDEVRNELEYTLKMSQYQLACSIESIVDDKGMVVKKPLSEYADVKAMHDEIVSELSEAKYNMMMSAFRKFESVYVHMQSKAYDSDFWEETPGNTS